MGTKEEHNKLLEKLKVAEIKAKASTLLSMELKRKQKMIQDKNRQIDFLQSDLD